MKRINHKLIVSALAFSMVFFSCHIKSQDKKYTETGIASFYADKFEGRKTASGEIYYHIRKTAAHPDLPFGSVVKVTNLENHKFVVVRINDRGPFVQDRIIDLSKSAAQELGFVDTGLAKVKIELIASTDDLPGKDSKNAEKSEYYQLDAQKASPKGSGIQVGSFSTNENLLRSVERLQTKYNKPVFVEIAESDGQKLFRVIVGRFATQQEAEKFKKILLHEFPDCYVVSFKK
ncbi:MAG: rare lipoprotein [Bacteroidales bacterium]|jgi:rare lipoprotein A|nr:rare lipoprotein [Bacteroidales bacterium]